MGVGSTNVEEFIRNRSNYILRVLFVAEKPPSTVLLFPNNSATQATMCDCAKGRVIRSSRAAVDCRRMLEITTWCKQPKPRKPPKAQSHLAGSHIRRLTRISREFSFIYLDAARGHRHAATTAVRGHVWRRLLEDNLNVKEAAEVEAGLPPADTTKVTAQLEV